MIYNKLFFRFHASKTKEKKEQYSCTQNVLDSVADYTASCSHLPLFRPRPHMLVFLKMLFFGLGLKKKIPLQTD